MKEEREKKTKKRKKAERLYTKKKKKKKAAVDRNKKKGKKKDVKLYRPFFSQFMKDLDNTGINILQQTKKKNKEII